MRVSREQAEKNRQKVLETAAREFRQCGIDGIGVAELMKSAGLTHGGFYGQFKSKDDLVTQAVGQALKENDDNWALLMRMSDDHWEAFKHAYLSPHHQEHPESGCAFTTLAVEAPRRGNPLKAVMTKGLRSLLGTVESIIPRKRGKTRREQAMVALSTMVGAIILARAVDDEALAKELLAAAKGGV
ncbi:TetR/AcrR family transcriptional regulator [Marinobacter sp. F4216]|uniref:TetR/AcrR family transcriptional regulator n=1 Tax=Marinobacter sp. F4216 TaxID=2874281 RepID=UPI001CC15095|nr:TetR/AcrR family transcriptional regulator [Marinobacter sp. F4216]MBZ2169446.1 TetR/AcrR family transcriptional regulator [Marinobacter sp. F4216]